MFELVTKQHIDEQLIKLMGSNARQSSNKLAKQLAVSPATVRRRLNKLIDNNILRIVGIINPVKAGFPIQAILALDVAQENVNSVLEALASQPQIAWISSTTGRYDVIVWAQFRSTEHLSSFLGNELASMEGVRNCETFVALRVAKAPYLQSKP